MEQEQERHWIDNVADLISGRMHNTLVSLKQRIDAQENKMTQNEQTIMNAAQQLTEYKAKLDAGIEALLAKIDQTPGVEREDLSEELAALTNAVGGIGATAGVLSPAPAGTPAVGSDPMEPGSNAGDVTSPGLPAGPIDHPAIQPDPLGSPTDAGVPTEVSQPGTGGNDSDTPTTPVVDDATNEANPNETSSDDPATGPAPAEEELPPVDPPVVSDGGFPAGTPTAEPVVADEGDGEEDDEDDDDGPDIDADDATEARPPGTRPDDGFDS